MSVYGDILLVGASSFLCGDAHVPRILSVLSHMQGHAPQYGRSPSQCPAFSSLHNVSQPVGLCLCRPPLQEKQLIAAEAAYWAKAGSVYPGDHAVGGGPQLQQYKGMYQGIGACLEGQPAEKGPAVDEVTAAPASVSHAASRQVGACLSSSLVLIRPIDKISPQYQCCGVDARMHKQKLRQKACCPFV